MPPDDTLRVLIVDDEADILKVLDLLFRREGCRVFQAESGEAALAVLKEQVVDLACLDLRMPGMGGLELLRRLKTEYPHVEALVLTSHGSKEDAIEALRLGAADFIEKPFSPDYLRHRLTVMRRGRRLQQENRELRAMLRAPGPAPGPLIGNSPAMRQVVSIIDRVKDGDSTVLIQGESGTGKEQVARAIHFGGARAEKPFVTVDCGALSPTLIESELFGHVKGSFTGADGDKEGLLEAAADGTLFIDELTELTPPLQAKLLRAIQEREFRRVGSTAPIRLGARILAAARKDLESEVREGRLREDLYYRLSVVEIRLPPLRERAGDVALLVRYFLDRFGETKRRILTVAPEAMATLESYAWPGNVRELAHCVERALILGSGTILEPAELPEKVRGTGVGAATPGADRTLAAAEREVIRRVLEETGGNKRRAARILDISANTLYEKLKRYGL